MKMSTASKSSSVRRRMLSYKNYSFSNRRAKRLTLYRSILSRKPKQSQQVHKVPLQIDLLTGQCIDPSELKIKKRFVPKPKKKESSRARKGVQYKIPFWKGISGERKRAMKARCYESSGNDGDVFEMTVDGYEQFCIRLLEYLPKEIAALGSRESNRIAEIVAWVNRRYTDDPFSFEECCRIVGVHPDIQSENVLDTLKELYNDTFNHYRILRNNVIDAEAGDQRAVDWVLSESDVSRSFNDCCRALGFKPSKARAEILIPANMIPEPIEDIAETFSFDEPRPATTVNEDQLAISFD